MKQVRNITELIDKDVFGKDISNTIRPSVGQVLKNWFKKYEIDSIEKLNNFDYDSFIEYYLSNKSRKSLLEANKGSYEELKETLIIFTQSIILNRYCVYNNIDKKGISLAKYGEIAELKDFIMKYDTKMYPIYNGDSKDNGKIKNERDTLLPEVLEENEATKEEQERLKEFVAEYYTELKDLSPLIHSFHHSNKYLFLFDLAVGQGKSTSFGKFIADLFKNEVLMKRASRILFLVDSKGLINEEKTSILKNKEIKEDDMLVVYSNIDCIINNKDCFYKLPKIFSETKEYAELNHLLKDYEQTLRKKKDLDITNFKIIKESFEDKIVIKEREFRTKVRQILNKEFRKHNVKKIQDKIDFIEAKPELSPILKVYTNIYINTRKLLLMTVQKAIRPIDTIIGVKNLDIFTDENFIKNALVFIDEADAAYITMVKAIIENSIKAKFDILNFVNTTSDALFSLEYADWIYKNTNLQKKISDLKNDYKELIKNNQVKKQIQLTNEDLNWLFMHKEHFVPVNEKEKNYIYVNKNNECFIVNQEYIVENNLNINECLDLQKFTKNIEHYFLKVLRTIKSIANVYKDKENETKTYSEQIGLATATEAVLELLNIKKEHRYLDTIIEIISTMAQAEYNNGTEKDLYLNPSSLSKVSSPDFDNHLKINVNTYKFAKTPEKMLLSLLEKKAKVILSSGTISLNTAYSNFDIEWEPLQKYIYTPSEKAWELRKKYIANLYKYKENAIPKIYKTFDSIEEVEKAIIDIVNIDKKDNVTKSLRAAIETFKQSLIPTKDYYILNYLNIVYDMTLMAKLKTKTSIYFTKFSISKKRNIKDAFHTLLTQIQDTSMFKINFPECIFTDADNLLEDMESFKIHMKKLEPVALFMAYDTGNKGLNTNTDVPYSEDYIYINDMGKEFMEKARKTKECINVDIDHIYLGDITYLGSNIGFENGKSDFDTLKSIFEINGLLMRETISSAVYKSGINNILSYNQNVARRPLRNIPYFTECESKDYILNLLSIIIQSTGRKSRSYIKPKNSSYTIHSSILTKTRSLDMEDFLSEEFIDMQPIEVQTVLKYLFQEQKTEAIFLKNVDMISNSVMNDALNDIECGKPEKYRKIVNNLYSFYLTEEEYNSKDKDIQRLYMEIPFLKDEKNEETIQKNGYKYSGGDNSVHKYYPLYSKEKSLRTVDLSKVNNTISLLPDEIQSIVYNKFNLKETSKSKYILTPIAYTRFAGNIGEFIADYIMKAILNLDIKELPTDIYERFDRYVEAEDYVLVYDAKYMTNYPSSSIDYEQNCKKAKNKIKELEKHFGKPILAFYINTFPVEDNLYKTSSIYMSELTSNSKSKIVKIPSMFNLENRKISAEALQTIYNNIHEFNNIKVGI